MHFWNDGVHLNTAGAERVAETVFRYLRASPSYKLDTWSCSWDASSPCRCNESGREVNCVYTTSVKIQQKDFSSARGGGGSGPRPRAPGRRTDGGEAGDQGVKRIDLRGRCGGREALVALVGRALRELREPGEDVRREQRRVPRAGRPVEHAPRS